MKKDYSEKIYELLKDLVATKPISYSAEENNASDYLIEFFGSLEYFKDHPVQFGRSPIPNDPFGRCVPYALLLGNSKKTVVTMGHFDVVEASVYGAEKHLAFELGDALEARLAKKDLPPLAREDMESGEWIWGRGSNDMLAGLAIHMALFEDYALLAQEGKLDGSWLFMGVAGEESYSAGMRHGVTVLKNLKDEYDLDYRILCDPEPNSLNNGKHLMSLGSVGKVMPTVVVQGITSHVGECFSGISPVGILAEIFKRTDTRVEFCDEYMGEVTPPPTWTNFRDKKEIYDVSIPLRAAGYMTVLSLYTTPEQLMDKLKNLSAEAYEAYIKDRNDQYQIFKTKTKFANFDSVTSDVKILTFKEITEELLKAKGEAYTEFFNDRYKDIVSRIHAGSLNYPDATLELMSSVLDFADYSIPVILLGFAPPYYPSMNSNLLKGKEGRVDKLYDRLSTFMAEKFNISMDKEYYSMGISDMSYCGMDKTFDYEKFKRNTPMWGECYSFDLAGIEELSIPSVEFGPLGRDCHQWTERVQKRSLFIEVPSATKEILDFAWND